MKKMILSTLLTSTLLLSACGDEESQGTIEADDTEEVQKDTANEEENNETVENTEESPEDTNENTNEASDDDLKESPEQLYKVTDNLAYISVLDGKEANKNVALLTYDDAPDKHALEIANILIEKDAPAIFFVNGMYLEDEEGKETLKKIYDMGFTIGNHSQTHADLQSISEEKQKEEITRTNDLVEEITGTPPRFFRAPFGQNTDYSKQLVKEEGMSLMNWTYGYDWEPEYQNAEALTDIMLNTNLLVPGSNLLMHDRTWTTEATPEIIDGLREKDYELLDPELIQSVASESEEQTNE